MFNDNLDDMVLRSKEGSLSANEIDRAADLLKRGTGPGETYKLLYVIARGGARGYESLVAEYLEYNADPMVARLALQTLCTFWGGTSRYLDSLHRFLKGVDWDEFGDVRQVAMTAAGEFLSSSINCEILSDLLALSQEDNESEVERRIAIEAIAQALGSPVQEAIDSYKGEVDWENWARGIRDLGRARLRVDCDQLA